MPWAGVAASAASAAWAACSNQGSRVAHVEVAGDDVAVVDGLGAQVGFEGDALVAVVEGFDGLLEADGDEQADDDGGDVEEEVAPGVGGVVGRVDVEHGCLFRD